jgi:pimeloyl-ACP methyl ester carboxylesterase
MKVVLLHGLARTTRSVASLGRILERAGHEVAPLAYRSRQRRLSVLARELAVRLDALGLGSGGPDTGFVTHSMGGLLLRALAAERPGVRWGRSVLLGCPLRGSILAERLCAVRAVRMLFGPALQDLSPAAVASLPDPPCVFGVIAGSTWSPLLPGAHFLRAWARGQPSDSTVLVEETRSPAATHHLVLPGVHSLLPQNARVQHQVLAYLATGRFDPG